jgi:methionine-rich copper-binding protein CopC
MHSGLRKRFALVVFGAATALLIVVSAAAHAVLLESTPAANSTVAGPDISINLRFNVRIDAGRSRLTLVPPSGSVRPLEIGKQTSEDTLSASASGLPAGEYRLRWQVLASDGHITRGEIPFTVMRS